MRRKSKITMTPKESAAEAFERFLLTKRAGGVKTKTIETYSQHFHAISKHLDTTQGIEELTADDLKSMIVSMQQSGLSPNSIKSYSITLKAFLSWCNSEDITTLNMAKYKGEAPNPHLHIHVRPRYKNAIVINDNSYEDTEFTHHYALKKESLLLDDDRQTLYALMKKHFA